GLRGKLGVVVAARGRVDEVTATLHREVEVVVTESTVTVVFLTAMLLRDDVRDLLRETEGLATGEDRGVLGEVHVGVVPTVVGLAVTRLAGGGDRDTHFSVGAKARVEVVHVPELEDVVLQLKALGKDV